MAGFGRRRGAHRRPRRPHGARKQLVLSQALYAPIFDRAHPADAKFVENVLGTYGLPYGVTLNVRVNGKDHVVPMVVEEPSVVAAASNAAKSSQASPPAMPSSSAPSASCSGMNGRAPQ